MAAETAVESGGGQEIIQREMSNDLPKQAPGFKQSIVTRQHLNV